MFIAARMKKIEILTLMSDEPRVTEAVGQMGVLHLTRAPAAGDVLPVEGPQSRETETHIEALEARVDAVCTALGVDPTLPAEPAPHSTIQEAEDDLKRIESEVTALTGARDGFAVDRRQLEKLLRDTSILMDIDAPVERLEHMSFLHFAIGTLGPDAALAAEKELGDRALVLPYRSPFGEAKAIAISSKKNRWALESALEKRGFKRDSLPADQKGLPRQITELAELRMKALLERVKETDTALRAASERHAQRLLQIRRRLRTEYRVLKARENFARTWATMLITGWVPADRVDELCEIVLDITRHHAVIEFHDPLAQDEAPPTLFRNHPLIRPFEMLVSNYSTPHYNEIEPTPFIAVLFLVMFGLMFGDIGHSSLLLITGAVLWLRARGRLRDAGVIATFCGISGILFGAFYGSFFGLEQVGGRPIGYLHPLENANRVLLLTVLFGVVVISLGIVLNIINHIRQRDYAEASFDRFGVVGGIFYWGSLAIAARGYTTGKVSSLPILLLVIAPLAVVFLRKPAAAVAARIRPRPDARHDGFLIVFIEGAAEAFETVLAYVANTLSFARIGAFALAHAGLCMAVFRLIDVVKTMPGGPLWAVLVFVFGTLVIVLLEGMIVAIQSLRLEYYEFFGKFFRGEGRRYEPFDLKV